MLKEKEMNRNHHSIIPAFFIFHSTHQTRRARTYKIFSKQQCSHKTIQNIYPSLTSSITRDVGLKLTVSLSATTDNETSKTAYFLGNSPNAPARQSRHTLTLLKREFSSLALFLIGSAFGPLLWIPFNWTPFYSPWFDSFDSTHLIRLIWFDSLILHSSIST